MKKNKYWEAIMIKRALILITLLCTMTAFLYACDILAGNTSDDGGQTAETPNSGTTEETPDDGVTEEKNAEEPKDDVDDSEAKFIFTLLDDDTYSVKGKDKHSFADGKVVIPDSYNGKPVTVIVTSAFGFYDNITEVVMPDSIISIESVAFAGCTKLRTIRFSSNLTEIPVACFADCDSLENVTLPDGLTKLCHSAFINCRHLTTVDIPNTVSVIEDSVFSGCLSLESVIIPDGVTTIGMNCFSKCYSLGEITIPKSVKAIVYRAFYLSYIGTVYYGGSEEEWSEIAIDEGNEDLTSANIKYSSEN